MASVQRPVDSKTGAKDIRATLGEKHEQSCEERWQTVLDDPAFRRLLRDGHRAATTANLPARLEDKE